MKWTDEQRKVIDSRTGNLLVSAAAGSGKTAVLVERIIEMILGVNSKGDKIGKGMDVDELLVVTFTKAAASQMKAKIADALSDKAEEMPYDEHIVKQMALLGRCEITTIDSFCLGIVKDYFNAVGIDSNFDIADKPEMELIKSDVMDEVLEECYEESSEDFIRLVKSFSRKESDKIITEMVEKIYGISSSFPRPSCWLACAKKALMIENEEELAQNGWYKSYENNVKQMVASAALMAASCLEVCNRSNGPAGYIAAIESDRDMLDGMKAQKSIGEIKSCYTDFAKLGRCKKDSCDAELQNYVKNVREKYKKLIKTLVADIKPMDKIVKETRLMGRPLIALIELTEKYRERLSQEKRKKNVYEFHDIEEFALEIVCAGYDEQGNAIPSETGKAISQKYKEILIDEYQDSNFLQEDILNCVSGCGKNTNNIFMVGDIKQSIYSFRMARPDLFLNKYNTYSEEEDGSGCRKIILSNNFRSAKSILDSVNRIFAPLMASDMGGIEYDKEAYLNPGPIQLAESEDDMEPELYLIGNNTKETEEEIDNTEIEAMFIANKIDEIVNGEEPMLIKDEKSPGGKRSVRYKDIVILLRSVKNSSMIYDRVFSERGIPLYLESEQGYFDATEVNTLLSMLAVVDNVYIDYDMAAVLRSPLVGLNEEQLAHIVGIYNAHMKEQDRNNDLKNGMLYDKVTHYMSLDKKDDISEKLSFFLNMLEYLKAEKNYMSISDMIRYILQETGYYWFVAAMGMGKRRQANIDMLMKKADAYEESSFKGLFNFLRYIERLKVNDIDFAEAGVLSDNEDTVRLMTMHKSKGLEFPVVFVSGLGKELRNKDAQSSVVVHQDFYLASHAIDIKKRIKQNTFARKAILDAQKSEMYAEEMRILYVALTRAKQKLYITACADDADKMIKKCEEITTVAGRISYGDKIKASSMMELMLMSIHAGCAADGFIEINSAAASDILIESCERAALKSVNGRKDINEEEQRSVYIEAQKELAFRYRYGSANYKSKMSITEIKKMQAEGEENRGEILYKTDDENIHIPIPDFMSEEKAVHANEIGTAMHKVMELIDFQRTDMASIRNQIDEMFDKEIFAGSLKSYISIKKIYQMLNSNIGRRMAAADSAGMLYRERQFYISMKPDEIWKNKENSEDIVVVQGIIDAYFIEEGQVVLLDYKTDNVADMEALVKRYSVQLKQYASTIERITGYKVKEKVIYSFYLNKDISF